MKAAVYRGQGIPLAYDDWPDPLAEEGKVLVQLRAAAINRRDLFITQGLYPGIQTPAVLGSDGSGLADGREVIINPNQGWGSDPRFPARAYRILGMPSQGTFAEAIAVPADRLVDKPPHLSWEEAAALPLAGMTAYRALFTRGQLKPGEKVLVTGIGGGVALFAFQFARAIGASVFVTSGSDEKRKRALSLGAAGGANYRHADWADQLSEQAGGFDMIIDSAGGEGFSRLLKLTNPGGRLVVYGGSLGAVPKVSPQLIFWRQISILGTSMATDEEFSAMVGFVHRHRLHPLVDSVYSLDQAEEALQRMAQGAQFGKIVIRI